MAKNKEEWRKVVEALVRAGAPYDMVKRFEVLTRPFFENAKRGFWPLQYRGRCCAFFAAAAISKVTGNPVDRIIFLTPHDRFPAVFGRNLRRHLFDRFSERCHASDAGRCRRLMALIGDMRERIDRSVAACCREGERGEVEQVFVYLAYAAAMGDREMFDTIESVVVALQDMMPLAEDAKRPSVWYVLAG